MIAKTACAAVCLAAVGAMTALGVTGRLEPLVEKYVFGGLPACEFADLVRGMRECRFVQSAPYTLGPWPVIDHAMRAAFDKAAKATLYDEGCRCLIWLGYEGAVKRAPWPPTDEERWEIIISTGLTPFNWPEMPPMPRRPDPGI